MPREYARQVPAVARAIRLVEALGANPGGLTAKDLEAVVDGSRSSLYALLNTLEDHDWIRRDAAGRATLGPALRALSPRDLADGDLERAFGAAVEAVDADESIALVAGHGSSRVLAVRHPDRLVRCAWSAGDAVASGPARELLRTGDGRSEDPIAVHAGPELVELAAPVCQDGRTPVAAVVVGVPAHRADDAAVATQREVVEAVAVRASLRLGAPSWQPWASQPPTPGTRRPLTDAEVDDVLAGATTAQLACVRPDGTPHVVPLWFEWEGDEVVLAAAPGSQWLDHVGGGATVSLTVEAAWPRTHRVFITGTATPLMDLPAEQVAALRGRLARRHLGDDAARWALDDEPSAAAWRPVRVVPDRIVGRAGLTPVAP